VRYAREFINGRRVRSGRREMNRLYVAESTPTITGAMADHKLRIKPSAIAEALKALIGHAGANGAAGEIAAWAKAAAADLQANHGAGLVVVGENQPPIVHAAAHQLNVSLGNVGKTVSFIEPVEAGAVNHGESLRQLVSDMNAGAVETLLMLGGNPVYDAPADVDFLSALKKVPLRIHHSLYDDETSFQCHWHLPAAHELESWGDARAFDGTASIIQPLIAPLYQGRTAIEVLSILTKMQDRSGYELIRDYWQKQHNSADF
jgi:molybdopterin-containing oxidoreductase family iron-sulfur binding subunit